MMKAVFLDSMIFLHYKPIEDVDWAVEVGADRACIVGPRVTIAELDKHKDTHRLRTIRDRARRVLMRLEGYFPKAELRPMVEVAYYPVRPTPVDIKEKGLDPESNDDVLIATVLQYGAKNPGVEVVLVSADTGPRLTARHHNIPVLAPRDELLLPGEPDPLVKENEDLRRQVLKLQGARPDLALEFEESDQPTHLQLRMLGPLPYPQEQISAELAKLGVKYPIAVRQARAAPFVVQIGADEDHERYNRDRSAFLTAYEAYLKAKWEHDNLLRRTASLRLKLVNKGSQPADDVDIRLHFPDGFKLLEKKQQQKPPVAPTPPAPPRTPEEVMRAMAGLSLRLPDYRGLAGIHLNESIAAALGNVSGLRIKKSNSYDVELHVAALKHGFTESLPEFIVEFDSDRAKSFAIE